MQFKTLALYLQNLPLCLQNPTLPHRHIRPKQTEWQPQLIIIQAIITDVLVHVRDPNV